MRILGVLLVPLKYRSDVSATSTSDYSNINLAYT